jgi:hypothetical protein
MTINDKQIIKKSLTFKTVACPLHRASPASAFRNPAGPALHNKTLCKLARGNDEPHAANAATALKRHTARVLSRCQGSGSFAASTPATSRKALRVYFPSPLSPRSSSNLSTIYPVLPSPGFRRSLQCPAAPARSLPFVIYCHRPSLVAPQRKSRRVIWTLGPCTKRF